MQSQPKEARPWFYRLWEDISLGLSWLIGSRCPLAEAVCIQGTENKPVHM